MKNLPQWMIVVADICYVIYYAIHHDETVSKTYDGWMALGSFIITMYIYYKGGFFNCWLKLDKPYYGDMPVDTIHDLWFGYYICERRFMGESSYALCKDGYIKWIIWRA